MVEKNETMTQCDDVVFLQIDLQWVSSSAGSKRPARRVYLSVCTPLDTQCM